MTSGGAESADGSIESKKTEEAEELPEVDETTVGNLSEEVGG